MKKALAWTAGTILGLVVAALAAVLCIWGREIRTISSVKQVSGDGYLYEMTNYTRYDLDDVIENDIDANAKLLEYVIGRVSRGLYRPHIEKA